MLGRNKRARLEVVVRGVDVGVAENPGRRNAMVQGAFLVERQSIALVSFVPQRIPTTDKPRAGWGGGIYSFFKKKKSLFPFVETGWNEIFTLTAGANNNSTRIEATGNSAYGADFIEIC